MGEKKFLEKCHFLVPKIGFTQFLNVLGHFWQFFKFFIFLKVFRVSWSEKWAKKIFSKRVIFSAQNWFHPIFERFGSFSAIFQIFHFFESFPSFFVWKMGEKKFLEKCHFLVPKIGVFPISERFGSFLAIFKIRALFGTF